MLHLLLCDPWQNQLSSRCQVVSLQGHITEHPSSLPWLPGLRVPHRLQGQLFSKSRFDKTYTWNKNFGQLSWKKLHLVLVVCSWQITSLNTYQIGESLWPSNFHLLSFHNTLQAEALWFVHRVIPKQSLSVLVPPHKVNSSLLSRLGT